MIKPQQLSLLLLDFFEASAKNHAFISLNDILNQLKQQGFGVALFICGLLCMVPMPGPNAVLAIPLFIMAPQMILNKPCFWLPAWVGQRQLSSQTLLRFYKKILPKLLLIEKFAKPRLAYFVPQQQLSLIGMVVAITAVAIALPLPVPGSNTVPSAALALLGLGIFMADGLLVLIGGSFALLTSFGLFGLVFFVYNSIIQKFF